MKIVTDDEFEKSGLDFEQEFLEEFLCSVFSRLIALILFVIAVLAWIIVLDRPAHSGQISEPQAVRAIVGEASNQGFDGMLAVACAIRNRGTLDGVYGVKSDRIYKESKEIVRLARLAWQQSESVDVTDKATHWENVNAFGVPWWSKSMVVTKVVKDHTFYRVKR